MRAIDYVLDQQFREEKADYEMFLAAESEKCRDGCFWCASILVLGVLLVIHWLLGIGW